ncbi:hypothetical protein CKO11_07020 [Rhodobacter sp. TJ_12]|nr:hypothetical protein [Rhodobacter sp. TJ_12]
MSIESFIDYICASSIATGVIAAAIFGVLGYFARGLKDRYDFRFERRFWKPFASSAPGRCVRTAIVAKEGSAGSLAKVSLTDVQAYSDIISELDVLRIKTVMVTPQQHPTLHQFTESGLICLGGPIANTLSRSLIARFSAQVPVSLELVDKTSPLHGASKAILRYDGQDLSAELEDNYVKTDYALILYTKRIDPDVATSGPVLLAFGLRGMGTQEAVRYVRNNKRRFLDAPGDGLWCLLKFSFSGVDRTTDEVIASGSIQ